MTRKTMDDIIISKRSIRQIPISRERKPTPLNPAGRDGLEKRIVFPGWQRKPLNPKFMIWLIAMICLLALFFGISIIFSSATVIIMPKTQVIIFNNDFSTTKLNSATTTDIAFEVLTVKQTASETVQATAEKEVSQKASGKIIIYNNYSSASQRLINNTRFESSNGKVYRINSSVVVPGVTKSDGKAVPGSIEATVYADQPGEDYNLKLSDLVGDFTVPGFKGDVRYQTFYARLKTDITGGLIGKQKIVGDEMRKTAEDSIKAKLKEQLLKELYAVKPENYLIFDNSYSIDYTEASDTIIDSNVKISIDGELNSIVFNGTKFSKYFATKKIDDFDGLPTEFIPSDNLIVTLTGADNTGLWKNKILQLKLNGSATIRWQYDVDTLKRDLAGKSEADLKNLLTKYQNSVIGIKVVFSPVWTRYIPDNINRIKVKEDSLDGADQSLL